VLASLAVRLVLVLILAVAQVACSPSPRPRSKVARARPQEAGETSSPRADDGEAPSAGPREALERLYQRARWYYIESQERRRSPLFLTPSTEPTPPLGACCASGRSSCVPDPALWASEPWRSLEFSVDEPHGYSYQYLVASDDMSFTVKAFGDLDCDGVYSTFFAIGEINATFYSEPRGTMQLRQVNERE
jgi:hypothetical protein